LLSYSFFTPSSTSEKTIKSNELGAIPDKIGQPEKGNAQMEKFDYYQGIGYLEYPLGDKRPVHDGSRFP